MNKVSKTVFCGVLILFSQYSVAKPNLDEISQPAPVAPPPPDRYNMYTKDEFFQGIRDGRVWTLLTHNQPTLFNLTNVYTQDNQDNTGPSGDYSDSDLVHTHWQRSFYYVLFNNYGLNREFIRRRSQGLDYFDPLLIMKQLKIIALLNAPMYAENADLKALYADASLKLSRLDPNFLESYKAFLKDYNDEWAKDAPNLLRNSYFLKKISNDESIKNCKKTDNYKLYDSAVSIKMMDSAIAMSNMALNLGGGSYQNQAGLQSDKKGSIYIRAVEFEKYKKLGGHAKTTSEVTVPVNPCT